MIFARRFGAAAAVLCALGAAAPAAAQEQASRGSGAILRVLDKVSSVTSDLDMNVGDSVDYGRLTLRLGECRYPEGDPNSDAFAQMVIVDRRAGHTIFDGWMIATSPALSALDDARYDVWVLSCKRQG
ncbi:MAG: DUF2155 domain-containing protein [Paracoccus sp. (in: a-proteobacteria)]|nr:DUF2155 domain-containing protein [Paracoccus sp. (in: a-proteobacteria)]